MLLIESKSKHFLKLRQVKNGYLNNIEFLVRSKYVQFYPELSGIIQLLELLFTEYQIICLNNSNLSAESIIFRSEK